MAGRLGLSAYFQPPRERYGKIERHQVEAGRKKGWWEAERWLVTILYGAGGRGIRRVATCGFLARENGNATG